jgi:hypothetical protein
MARKQTVKQQEQTDFVVGLETQNGQYIVLENNPDEETVRNFVKIQNEKYKSGLAGNATSSYEQNPAFLIKSAAVYPNYTDATANQNRGAEIDISGL